MLNFTLLTLLAIADCGMLLYWVRIHSYMYTCNYVLQNINDEVMKHVQILFLILIMHGYCRFS